MSKPKDLSMATPIAHHLSPESPYPPYRVAKIGLVCGLLLGAGPVLADPPVYSLTEIPNQPGSTSTAGTAINNKGDIALQSFDSNGQSHALVWQFANKTVSVLGTLGGTATAATDVNDCGDVVGWSQLKGNTVTHAVLYHAGSVIDLAPTGKNSSAAGINNLGAIVGSFDVNGVSHPAQFQQGTVKDLTGQAGTAARISTSGLIIGNSNVTKDGFIIDNGQITTLDDGANNFPIARGVNDFGDIAAVEENGPAVNIPFLFQDGMLEAVINGAGDVSLGEPLAINNSLELVGFLPADPPFNPSAFATYSRGQTVYNLNELLDPADPLKPSVTLVKAFGINDSGWIGAIGSDSRDHSTHVFLLTRKTPAIQLQRLTGSCSAPATIKN